MFGMEICLASSWVGFRPLWSCSVRTMVVVGLWREDGPILGIEIYC